MGNIAATLSLNVPAITALCTGQRGSIIYAASGTPYNIYNTYLGTPGLSGDFYIDTATGFYYGPKTTTWPTTPIFTLNVPTSAYPLVLVSGLTGYVIPTYGNNTVSLSGSNLGILGGTNNFLSGSNSFILGSNITAYLTGFTIVNNLSGNTLFDIAGNSIQWNTAYSNSNTTSAAYTAATTLVDTNSAIWNNAYSALTSTSASWNSTSSTVLTNSGNWNTSWSVISSLGYVTYTYVPASSSIIPSYGTNTAPGLVSNVDGGNYNHALSAYSSVLGGRCNTASGGYSNITGGFSGLASGCYSNIAGGVCNTASGYGSSIGGGTGNCAIGYNTAIAAGAYNTSSCCSSFIGGGKFNTASGVRSSVVGGYCNTASGNYSFVAGGSGNSTAGFINTFILGSNLSATQPNTTYVNNIVTQGSATVAGTITSSGSVGIGTTPYAALTVVGQISGVTGFAQAFSITGAGTNYADYTNGVATIYSQNNTGPGGNILKVGSAYAPNTFIAKDNGFVGIGTTNPGAALTVVGNISANGNIFGGTLIWPNNTSLYSKDSGGTTRAVLGVGSDNLTNIFNAGNNSVRILNQAGTATLVTLSDASGNLTASGDVAAFSDERLKKDVKTIDSALEKVNFLRGVSYERIDTGKKQIGVIAQEVEKVVPEVVLEGEEYKSVSYGNLVGLLIEAVKELTVKVNSLENELRNKS